MYGFRVIICAGDKQNWQCLLSMRAMLLLPKLHGFNTAAADHNREVLQYTYHSLHIKER